MTSCEIDFTGIKCYSKSMNGKKAISTKLKAAHQKFTSEQSSFRIGGERPIMVSTPEPETRSWPKRIAISAAVLVGVVLLVAAVKELIHIHNESTARIPVSSGSVSNTSSALPFSASGTIYFISGYNTIAAMKADGSGAESLYTLPSTYQSQGQISSLDVSSSGTELVFTYSQDNAASPGQSCIFSVNATGHASSLTSGCSLAGSPDNDSQPVLSPNGRTVYFYSTGRSSGAGIYKEPVRGGNVSLVVTLPYTNPATGLPIPLSSLTISPNGKTLAFPYYQGSSTVPRLYTVGTDGSHLQQLSSSPLYVDEVGSWSPDGSQILAVTGSNNNYLQTLDTQNGSVIGTLTTTSASQAFARASWSPDGKLVVYDLNDASGGYNVYLVNSSSGLIYQTTRTGSSKFPVWVSRPSPPYGGAPLNL